MLGNETCKIHDNEVGKIDKLDTKLELLMSDIKWFKKFGSWWMTITGGAIVLFVPLIITFAVYVHSIDRRLAVVEQIIKDHIVNTVPQTIKKVPETPN